MSASQQAMGPRSGSTGPNAAVSMGGPPGTPASNTPQGSAANQNLNQIVIDYLSKKGYTQTEMALRKEMNNVDSQGRAVHSRAEEWGGQKYFQAYGLLNSFIEDNLEIYKQELGRLRWPIFVYSFLNLVRDGFDEKAQQFFGDYKTMFEREREHEIRELGSVRLSDHVMANETSRLYWINKYRVTLIESTHFTLMSFLETRDRSGGTVIIALIQTHMTILTVNRASSADRSFAAMLARQGAGTALPDEDEGIPGHNPGSANTDINAPAVLTRLALGQMPPDAERLQDVRDELEDLDATEPPAPGEASLTDVLERQIKREGSDEGPSREAVPYPPALARDVVSDVEKIRAYRDRFKLAPRSGGVGPGVSVCMYTLHNTFDGVCCVDFSGDNAMLAAGFEEHYIRIWSLDGRPLPSALPTSQPLASRRLIGHSGPVYAVSFSPSMSRAGDSSNNEDGADANGTTGAHDDDDAAAADSETRPSLRPQVLVSASADGTIRLWELGTYSNLVIYKGHTSPVWDVRFSPHGHYFLSGGQDRTGRLWATSSAGALRILAGHDGDVDVVAWHANGAYAFTASSDRSTRMWDLASGRAVRLFTGHTGVPTALAGAPSGRLLASADDAGNVLVWNLETGRRVRVLRGHGRGGVWSLAWSVESTVLVSAGADASVRVWDIALTAGAGAGGTNAAAAPASASASAGEGAASGKADGKAGGAGGSAAGAGSANDAAKAGGSAGAGAAGSATAAGKLGGRAGGLLAPGGGGGGVSSEQISCFPTKRTPVYAVRFTEMNLVLAAGAYMP